MVVRRDLNFAAVCAALCFGGSPSEAEAKGSKALSSSVREAGQCHVTAKFWRRVAVGSGGAYCSLLSKARASLKSRPRVASALATKAARLKKENQDAELLIAQAALLFQKPEVAHRLFEQAQQRHRPSRLPVVVHVSAARAAALSGNYKVALDHYRAVALRIEKVRGPREQVRILVEAATAAGYATANSGREARAYLNVAKRKNAPLLHPVVNAAWVLSLRRDGRDADAKVAAESMGSGWGIHRSFEEAGELRGGFGEVLPVLPTGEGFFMAAALASHLEPQSESLHLEAAEKSGASLPKHLRDVGATVE